MEWTATGIVLGSRKHSENDVILEVMTEAYGRHLGLVRGGRSRIRQPQIQPGNELQVTWRARLPEQLGTYSIEPLRLRAAELMASPLGLHGVQHLGALLRMLPERDPHAALYRALTLVLDQLQDGDIGPPLLIRFELELLNELGFGLDLSCCAATGSQEDLAYVSPKSGRAVSRDAGRPYHDKLLPLPDFLIDGQRQPGSELLFKDLSNGFKLTRFFLARHEKWKTDPAIESLRQQLLQTIEKGHRQRNNWQFVEYD